VRPQNSFTADGRQHLMRGVEGRIRASPGDSSRASQGLIKADGLRQVGWRLRNIYLVQFELQAKKRTDGRRSMSSCRRPVAIEWRHWAGWLRAPRTKLFLY